MADEHGEKTINIPLRDVGSAVHPAGGVEIHAMMVQGGWQIERVGQVKEEGVGCVDGDWGRSVEDPG